MAYMYVSLKTFGDPKKGSHNFDICSDGLKQYALTKMYLLVWLQLGHISILLMRLIILNAYHNFFN